jgi:hypothetical protein
MPIDRDKEYLELLKKNHENLHTSVWEAHKVSWTFTGIFVPIISGGFGLFIKEYGGEPLCIQKCLISLLLIAVTWFWYFMIKNFDAYNRVRFRQLRHLERAFERIRTHDVPREFQFKQYRLRYTGWFNKLCLSLAIFLTAVVISFFLWDANERISAITLFFLGIVIAYLQLSLEEISSQITVTAPCEKVWNEIIRHIENDKTLRREKALAVDESRVHIWRRILFYKEHPSQQEIESLVHADEEQHDDQTDTRKLYLRSGFLQRHTIRTKCRGTSECELKWEWVSINPSFIFSIMRSFDLPTKHMMTKRGKLRRRLDEINESTKGTSQPAN